METLAPFIVLGLLLAALVAAINLLGQRLEKHRQWLELLDTRVGNLHKQREKAWVRTLQNPRAATTKDLVPPPLPPRAPTLGAIDWRDDDLDTEELLKKETGRYPLGVPPTKGPKHDPSDPSDD